MGPVALSYAISKAALDQLTRSLALDLAPKQVRVNSVNPAIIATNMIYRSETKEMAEKFLKKTASGYPLGRVGQPEEVAKAIAFLASSESSFSTGVLLKLDAGVQLDTRVAATDYE
ncbi:hypothetical protein EB796_024171 [Bugula neritina]|uniref:DCXR n=1 Tax=Bugula neritina TaxID=10212 RepID=A0A7J7IVT8_BUGNE|nr:hypothetical protein EB796_024171 [Bugula neritina]